MPEKIVVPEECALIVEDMQKDFCNEDGALFIGDTVNEIIARISRLIERAIGKEVHLIFAQDWHSHDDDEFEIGYYYKFRCALLLYLIVSYPTFRTF